ncbi:hypothetical protein PS3A_61680 [Pseudomonas sp. 3A(2025)]
MDSNKEPDDDGIIRIKRLEPGHVDIVLGAHPNKNVLPRPAPRRAYGLIILCTLLAILSVFLLVSQFKRHSTELFPVAAKPAANTPRH